MYRCSIFRLTAASVVAMALASCGGGGGGGTVAPQMYTIAGAVTGLASGAQLVLKNNGGDSLTVNANGTFTFATSIAASGAYAVTVGTQPTGQTCTVSNGSGSVSANVSNVAVACSTNTFTISGMVTGLAGTQVSLQNNGSNTLTATADGSFMFTTPVAFNGSYAVTVSAQPTGKTCTVSNGTGAGVTANVSNITVTCSTNTFTIGGTLSGLAPGQQVTLQNNSSNALTIPADGAFMFTTPVAFNGSYAVTVSAQPTGQMCTVSGGSGAGVTANVSNVTVTCSTNTYTIGGTLSGLASGKQVTLQNNGMNPLTVSVDGAFVFTTPVVFGGSYAVTVGTQPVGQTCTVSSGSGTGVMADVSSITVACSTNTYTIGGSLSGLVAGKQVTLQNNSSNPLTLTGNGNFVFTTPVAYNGSYAVTVDTQPVGQMCTVSNGSGANVAADVTNVAVSCARSEYAYVANFSDGNVSEYSIAADGTLSPIGTVAAGTNPFSVTVDPTGHFAYLVNQADSTASQYTIGTDGTLSPMTTPTVSTGAGPYAITVDPSGRYAYTTNYGDNTVSEFSIGGDGSLAPISGAVTIATGPNPVPITVDPTGQYAYVGNTADGTVSEYSIGVDGSLTSIGTIAAGTSPYAVAIDPSGHNAYVVNRDDNNVSQFSIGSNGLLSPNATAATVAAGTGPYAIAIDPAGAHAYVTSTAPDESISEYSIGVDGTLTFLTTVSIGGFNRAITVDPTGRYVYVPNGGHAKVMQYTVGSDGTLVSNGDVPAGGGPDSVAVAVAY